MKISNPELKVVRFGADDVIATSLFYGTDALGNYKTFNGVLSPLGDGTYAVTNVYGVDDADMDEIDGLKSGGSVYLPELGLTIPSTAMEPIARQAYEAYTYEDQYYSHGASYYDLYWQ